MYACALQPSTGADRHLSVGRSRRQRVGITGGVGSRLTVHAFRRLRAVVPLDVWDSACRELGVRGRVCGKSGADSLPIWPAREKSTDLRFTAKAPTSSAGD